jgi:hypothetical protein
VCWRTRLVGMEFHWDTAKSSRTPPCSRRQLQAMAIIWTITTELNGSGFRTGCRCSRFRSPLLALSCAAAAHIRPARVGNAVMIFAQRPTAARSAERGQPSHSCGFCSGHFQNRIRFPMGLCFNIRVACWASLGATSSAYALEPSEVQAIFAGSNPLPSVCTTVFASANREHDCDDHWPKHAIPLVVKHRTAKYERNRNYGNRKDA